MRRPFGKINITVLSLFVLDRIQLVCIFLKNKKIKYGDQQCCNYMTVVMLMELIG